jgi:hypothetical protein
MSDGFRVLRQLLIPPLSGLPEVDIDGTRRLKIRRPVRANG